MILGAGRQSLIEELANPLLDLLLERGSTSLDVGVSKICQSEETLAWLGRVPCVSDVLSLSMHSADALAPKVTRGRDSTTDMDLTGYGRRRLSCQTHTHTTTTITFHELLDIFHFIIAPLSVSLPLQVSQHQKAQEPGRTHKEQRAPKCRRR